MNRPLALLVLLALPLRAAEEKPALRIDDIASPAAGQAVIGASLATGTDRTIWLTWLELKFGGEAALKFSTFDAATGRWRAARTITRGANLYSGASDFPLLTAGDDGRATALWYVKNPDSAATAQLHHGAGYRAVVSSTVDGGNTWGAPAPVSGESDMNEFCALATLADGRVLATWLDGRAKKSGGHDQQLFARVIGSAEADTRIEARVCDCCHTSLTAFPDGTALLAFRGRSADEVRDVRVTRFRGSRWDEPRTLNSDDWRINGCPVNGPQLASAGGRVAVAWFTAADNDPRVLASFSSDAGGRFLLPLRLSEAKPLGRVATALLRDGAMLITFVDNEGGLWLRRVTPEFAAADALELTTGSSSRIKGFPRVALARDYDGGNSPAQLVVAYTLENGPGLRTTLVTIPEGDLLEAERNCDCAPTLEQLRGSPIRGTVVAAAAQNGTLRVQHVEVPGIFSAGTREFKVAPEILPRLATPGREFLGRVEKREGTWWLFDLRLIASAPR